MKQLLLLVLGCCVLGFVTCCSQPMGWEHQKPLERLEEAKLVVTGQFIKIENETRYDELFAYLITTKIDCVLRNDLNYSVESEIVIKEDATYSMCVSNMGDVMLNKPSIMSLRVNEAYDDQPEEIWFSNVNVQGAIYSQDELKPTKVVALCGYERDASKVYPTDVTQDGTQKDCPMLPKGLECVRASSGGIAISFSFLLLLCAMLLSKL